MKLARKDSLIFYPATKNELADSLGLARSSLYYQPKQPEIDLKLKTQIEGVMRDHPSYGHKRLALALKVNRKRALRVMKLFDLKPYRRRAKTPVKPADYHKPATRFPNLIQGFCPIRPNMVWAADFTYLRFQDQFIYLATIIDLFTREIVGWNLGYYHNTSLIVGALVKALAGRSQTPLWHHSDQGSEYEANQHIALLEQNKITISMSRKSSPWENGFQESFYSQFKIDLGRINRFDTVGELTEAISLALYYYNTKRIHTSLKMPPKQFHQIYQQNQTNLTNRVHIGV